MPLRRVAATLSTAVLALSLTACSNSGDSADAPNTDETLVIGINGNNPGLSYKTGATYTGFDVDVANYVAHKLGWSDSQIEWKAISTADRASALQTGRVDMVVSSYSMTADRAQQIDFAGPYFVAGEDLMVRMDEAQITGPHSLDGKVLCATTGSTGAERVKTPEYSAGVTLKELPDNVACMNALLAGEVDAVTTDDVILAGLVEQHPNQLKVLGSTFSTELYGIGLPKGSPDVAVVNTIINDMVSDGTWQSDFDENLGNSGYVAVKPPQAGSLSLATLG